MAHDATQRLTGKFIDVETLEPVEENGGSVGIVFYMHPAIDEGATAAAGTPVYVDREFIRKVIPFDRENIVERPVRDEDRATYATAYAKFKANPAPSEAVKAQQMRAEMDAMKAEVERLRAQIATAADPTPRRARSRKPRRVTARRRAARGA